MREYKGFKLVENPSIADVRAILDNHAAAYFWVEDRTDKGNAVKRKILVDATTAKALVVCYDAMSQSNKEIFDRMLKHAGKLQRLVAFCWKQVS